MQYLQNILLVEDESAHAELISRSFQSAAERVTINVVRSLTEANAYLKAQNPSIVLADYSLPDGTCEELVQEYGTKIPFIILTAQGNDQIAIDLMKCGAEDYWVKGPESFALIPEITTRVQRAWEIRNERKQSLLNELERVKAEAESASRAKNAFLANMGHEVRTPMNAILGMTHLAMHATTDGKMQGYLQKVEDSAKGLLRLLNGILDFARMEGKALELENIHFDLEDVLSETGSSVKAEAQRKGLELVFELSPQVPRRLLGDPLRIGQILYNIVGNAVKFSESGSIRIQIQVKEETKEEIRLHFSILDTGIGIDAQHLARLFEPFEQGDASISRKHGGIGLGLSICRHLVELMKGRIWVESELGKGTCVQFEVSLIRDKRVVISPDLSGIQGLRVLVVDDSESSREALNSMLRTLRIRPVLKSSGEDALQFLSQAHARREEPDLVMVDWLMPEMNGVEFAKKLIEGEPSNSQTSIVMMTAGNREELESELKDLPIHGMLSKPFTFSQLLDVIFEASHKELNQANSVQVSSRKEGEIQGARILLVDDNHIANNYARTILENEGAKIVSASNGQMALDYVFSEQFDLIVMDCQMPVMDGYEATRRIRRNQDLANLPILAMTASSLMEDRVRCILAGMNEHIQKPLEQEKFLDSVTRWIRYARNLRSKEEGSLDHIATFRAKIELNDPEYALISGGFDVLTAIERLEGDWIVYRNMLTGFVRNQSQTPTEILMAIQAGDNPKAIRLAHSLKSVSAYLGIRSLQSLAKTIEDHIGILETKEIISLVEELKIVLAQSLDVVAGYQKLLDSSRVNSDEKQIDTNQLINLLESSDSAAVEMAQAFELQNKDDLERGELAVQVRDYASRYQYPEALAALHKWMEKGNADNSSR